MVNKSAFTGKIQHGLMKGNPTNLGTEIYDLSTCEPICDFLVDRRSILSAGSTQRLVMAQETNAKTRCESCGVPLDAAIVANNNLFRLRRCIGYYHYPY